MDTGTIVQVFMGAIIMLLGWWNSALNGRMKQMEEKIQRVSDTLTDHRLIMAKDYATRDDIGLIFKELKEIRKDLESIVRAQ